MENRERAMVQETELTVVILEPELGMLETVLPELTGRAKVITAAAAEESGLKGAVEEAHVIVMCYAPVTPELIASAPRLRGITKYGVGVDSIDLAAASRAGVLVAHCPVYGSETIAEHAFALMICLSRKIMPMDRSIRSAGWVEPLAPLLGNDLAGKTLGIVGCGRIGRAIAARAAAFRMRCIACDPYVDGEALAQDGIEKVGLDDLLERADILTVHAVLTPETRGMIGERELARMKPSALVINVARGAIIDEPSLVRALREGRIAGAGLDVFAAEPLAPDHPLVGLDNVILTPHLAWYTREARERLERDALQSVVDLLEGRIPRHIKNPEAVQRYREKGRHQQRPVTP
jgi:D-3-phosphoglycerate dehydrogenase